MVWSSVARLVLVVNARRSPLLERHLTMRAGWEHARLLATRWRHYAPRCILVHPWDHSGLEHLQGVVLEHVDEAWVLKHRHQGVNLTLPDTFTLKEVLDVVELVAHGDELLYEFFALLHEVGRQLAWCALGN